jgi:cyclic pyranopterin phosphate synthase|tara:strand:+ start:804 stop:1718 length:915 start_codon:yes stop_codon:yes gene_type:complete
MPAEIFNKDYSYIKQNKILSYEEIIQISLILKKVGLKKIRITGGEPLLRKNIDKLIYKLKTEVGIEHVSMTTNGSLLTDEKLSLLKSSGLDSVTLSLDTLNSDKIIKINGTKKQFNLDKVLQGIEKYFGKVKTNTVVIKGINDNEILDIIIKMIEINSEVRFIEYMDVGESNNWNIEKVIPSKDILKSINSRYSLSLINTDKSSTAEKWSIENTNTSVGFISSITEPFCSGCNRARLSVDGKLYTCLFANEGYDLKTIIRNGASEKDVLNYFQNIWSKRSDRYSELRFINKSDLPKVEMSYIGG